MAKRKDQASFVWRCTAESADRGAVSYLAVLETVLAVGLSIGYAVYSEGVWHILWGVCLAPLLLLRTHFSMRLGHWSIGEGGWINKALTESLEMPIDHLWAHIRFLILAGPFMLLILTYERLRLTIIQLKHNPWRSVAAIPGNWRRLCLSTDSCHPPEVLPGTELCDETSISGVPRFSRLIEVISRAWKDGTRKRRLSNSDLSEMIVIAFFSLVGAFMFLPSLFLRYSVKSTSIVYVPFLFVPTPGKRSGADYVERQYSDATTRLLWWYALVVGLFTLGLLAAAIGGAIELPESWGRDNIALAFLLDFYVPTDKADLRLWHVARLINCIITVLLFFYASRARNELRRGGMSQSSVARVFERAGQIQATLACYVVFCGLYWLCKNSEVFSFLQKINPIFVPQ